TLLSPPLPRNSRRHFLKNLAWLLSSGVTGAYSAPAVFGGEAVGAQKKHSQTEQLTAAGKKKYEIAPWTGDDFTIGHRFRNRNFPTFPSQSEQHVDFVIIGGGIAGLTAAHYLKNHKVLLLEQYQETGGQSRGSSYRDTRFSYGAAYMSNV